MTVSSPKVGIVVLNFNGQACLLPCLRSLQRLQYQNFFVVVVDNASEDDSLALAQDHFPEFSFIKNTENRGFAAGMNTGMKAAFEREADWVWLFNNDALADERSLGALMAVATERRDAGLLSPCIYAEHTGALWFGKGSLDWWRMRATHVHPSAAEFRRRCYDSEFLTGCALLIKKETVEAIGFLDERFFLYYEDADFSWRARAKGFAVLVVPGARVWHGEQSQKNDQKLYHLVFSGLLFFHKHAQGWWRAYFLLYGTMRRLKNAIDVTLGRGRALTVSQAYQDFNHGR